MAFTVWAISQRVPKLSSSVLLKLLPYCPRADESTLAQVMACCLAAPSHYLNQCWLIMKGDLWHLSVSNFTASTQATILYNVLDNIFAFKFTATAPRVQWVNHNKAKQRTNHVHISLYVLFKFFLICIKTKHNKIVCIFYGIYCDIWNSAGLSAQIWWKMAWDDNFPSINDIFQWLGWQLISVG